jgi:hypothetical protein
VEAVLEESEGTPILERRVAQHRAQQDILR